MRQDYPAESEAEMIKAAMNFRWREVSANPTPELKASYKADFGVEWPEKLRDKPGPKPGKKAASRPPVPAHVVAPINQIEPVMEFQDIGRHLGVTPQRAQQIFVSGIRKLRQQNLLPLLELALLNEQTRESRVSTCELR